MKSKYEEYTQEQRLEDLENVIKIQCAEGNYNANDYMHGMANGLLLARTIITRPYGEDVQFITLREWKK